MEDPAPRLVVDAMNVIGSRPDGWWRDRDRAVRELADRLGRYSRTARTQVTLVVDGYPIADLPSGGDGLQVLYADSRERDAADDRIVDLLTELRREPGELSGTARGEARGRADPRLDVVVVTADRELRRRVHDLGAELLGPRLLLERLDQAGV